MQISIRAARMGILDEQLCRTGPILGDVVMRWPRRRHELVTTSSRPSSSRVRYDTHSDVVARLPRRIASRGVTWCRVTGPNSSPRRLRQLADLSGTHARHMRVPRFGVSSRAIRGHDRSRDFATGCRGWECGWDARERLPRLGMRLGRVKSSLGLTPS